MVSKHFHIVSSKGNCVLTVAAGITWQIAIGINISKAGIQIDVGPFWVAIEWC